VNDSFLPSSELAALPPLLRESTERHWQRFLEAGGVVPDALLAEVVRVFACSHFIAEVCSRHADVISDLVASGDLERNHDHARYAAALAARLEAVTSETELLQVLRRFRQREMVRIAWRDLAGRAGLSETLEDLSALADVCVDGALEWLHRDHTVVWGTPTDADGNPLRLVVFGMGKLGGRELNFSSDIDLIFCYPGEGETQGGRRSVTHQEFFVRLGQRLIHALDRTTADGFVFRVDMRLRPFGEAAALAISFDAMEEYYQTHGREWERYALIKARPVAGDLAAGERLLAALRPFVYRRYVDYGAFESLRDMKALIEQEVRRKGMAHNVKLGAGGIREVEFIGQAFQLIRGGRDPGLQQRSILPVLDTVRERQLLPGYVVDELVEAYALLRNVENRIQMVGDEQRHTLPEGAEERARLAFALGYADWATFDEALSACRRRVHEHFEQVFAAPQNQASAQGSEDLAALWVGALDERQAEAVLENRGYQVTADALRLITLTRDSHALRNLSERGHGRLDRLMPLLIAAVGQRREPDRTLQHVLRLVEAIARRTAYLALLVENPMALSQLVQLCSASPWIAALLTRHPVLLDELLDPRSLYYPPRRDAMREELAGRLAGVQPDDEEQQLEVLRQFKQANTLRVAAADIAEAVPLMVVSDHLTELAETILAASIQLAWRHLAARHGSPVVPGAGSGFAIVGYGKLGGIELGYGSDLDLVFLHAGEPGENTAGPRPVANAVFYTRLAQRLIHVLTAHTPSGVLYEVDTRLRPSGASGLLVSALPAFAEYQLSQAWTWEHQALVRARVVAGDPAVAQAFEAVRREVLGKERDLDVLRREVREMRERMRSELSRSAGREFDLKQGAGGIADIEFVVQYGVLAWAHRFPDLLEFTDNIRQIDALARNGLVSADEATLLADAYRAYRARVHRLTLRDLPALAPADEFTAQRAGVQRVWDRLLGSGN